MRIVLDTNILLVAASPKSEFYGIFESFINEEFLLCVTTEILLEYKEILTRHTSVDFAEIILEIIENAPNTVMIKRYFAWNLITADPDDNKFVDCTIASNAKFLVSEDKHFNILKTIPFPKVELLRIDEFREILGKDA